MVQEFAGNNLNPGKFWSPCLACVLFLWWWTWMLVSDHNLGRITPLHIAIVVGEAMALKPHTTFL